MPMSDEVRLLLLTAGGSDQDPEIRDLCTRPLDWVEFLELVRKEGAQPALGRRLRTARAELPSGVRSALEGTERRAELRMAYMEQRLVDVLETLSAAAVPVVLLKGVAMAASTYGSFRERPMSDFDLLVPADQAKHAQATLLRTGWTQQYAGELDHLYAGMHHLPPLLDARVPHLAVGLELHTDIIPPTHNPFEFSAAELWQSARGMTGLPEGVRVPAPTHLLLHCSIHFAWSHTCSTGAWRAFRDIAELARGGHLDWREFTDAAHEGRAQGPGYWALHLARQIAGAPVPAHVLHALRTALRPRMHAVVEQHLMRELAGPRNACPSYRLRRWLWERAMRPHLSGHGRARPWRVGEERRWEVLERTDRVEPDRFKGSRARRLGAALRYVKTITAAARVRANLELL